MTAGEVVDTIEPGIAFNTNAPVLSETVSKDGVYIDENTLLIIPPHLLRQSPFFLLAE